MRSDLQYFEPLLFWGRGSKIPQCLSIGAPTSPAISNILLYEFDQKLIERAGDLGLTVSRYADDITVSGESVTNIRKFERSIASILSKLKNPKLMLNDEKGVSTLGDNDEW
ncbi:reverse transcriptase domain-containing protein [Sphingopyxis sp. BSNA05]|uniref:reverse transcriptase domain-containing protein n=1 Tax=Sphingopyxis sp. BSNA05 TaxID=1236614 RepID=UPI002660212B|nr:reverse transcriptase domain-containing protein [Sphingopyxis sp. BSNA05]